MSKQSSTKAGIHQTQPVPLNRNVDQYTLLYKQLVSCTLQLQTPIKQQRTTNMNMSNTIWCMFACSPQIDFNFSNTPCSTFLSANPIEIIPCLLT